MDKNHHHPNQLEYNYIVDGIYIGTNQCCQSHFDKTLSQNEGIEAEISLEEDRIDKPFGIKMYLWLPTTQTLAPSEGQLDLGVTVLNKLVSMKKKVYVHCQNGHGRAPALVAAYLIQKNKTVEEAIDFIKEKRPSIHLEKNQIDALKKFSTNS